MKNILKKFAPFEWFMVLSVIVFTLYFSFIDKENTVLYLIIDAIAAISGILCVVLCAKGKKSQYIWGLLNVIGYIIIAFINKYYGEVMLNAIYYLPSQFVGYYLWDKHQNEETKKVEGRKLNLKNKVGYLDVNILFNEEDKLDINKSDKKKAKEKVKKYEEKHYRHYHESTSSACGGSTSSTSRC